MDGPAGFMAACIQDEFFLWTLRRGIGWRTHPVTDMPFAESNEACDQLTAEALSEIISFRFASGEHKRSDGKNELGLPRTRQRLIDSGQMVWKAATGRLQAWRRQLHPVS